eukprot:g26853.t1
MSLCHGTALKEIGGEDADDCAAWCGMGDVERLCRHLPTEETIDPQGLDNGTLHHLQTCSEHGFNPKEVLLHLIQSLITQSLDDGIIRVPAPIISRVYQTLSRGFVNLLNAKKIADTRFPFPFAQLISLLLFVNVILTPILVTSIFTQPALCVIFSFIPIFGMSCLNFIGVELENPFGQDDNDLPLDHFQDEMNNCLLMLLHSSADLLPDVDSMRCMTDVDEIREIMMESRYLDPQMCVKRLARRGRLPHQRSRDHRAERCPIAWRPRNLLHRAVRNGGHGICFTRTPHRASSREDNALLSAIPCNDDRIIESSKEEKNRPKHGEGKWKTEEQLKHEAMLQGLERMIGNLQSIKTAVEEQAKKVSQSTAAMAEFCEHLDDMLKKKINPNRSGDRVAPRRRNWECSLMRCT